MIVFYRAHYRRPSIDSKRWVHGWCDHDNYSDAVEEGTKYDRTLMYVELVEG